MVVSGKTEPRADTLIRGAHNRCVPFSIGTLWGCIGYLSRRAHRGTQHFTMAIEGIAMNEEQQDTIRICRYCLGKGMAWPYYALNDDDKYFEGRCEICGEFAQVTYGTTKGM